MSYEFYKILHLTSIFMIFMGLAGFLFAHAAQGTIPKPMRILLASVHGVGLTLALVSGFGLAARLGLVQGLPNWIYIKLGIWLILGGMIALAKRKSQLYFPLMISWILLGALAAFLAGTKPI